jgi:thiol-disulfide isomerase/thioredoxin
MPPTPTQIYLVYAEWCPHCVPISTERAPRLAKTLGVPLVLLDIDVREQELQADALVQSFGDWDPDYLIPQLFLGWSDGRVEHLMTGVPGSPSGGTRAHWDRLFDRFHVAATE